MSSMAELNLESSSVAFIFLTHFSNRSIIHEYKKISISVEGIGTPWFLLQEETNTLPKCRKFKNTEMSSHESLFSLGFPMLGSQIIPGSTHFPLLYFYKKHSEYAYYWLIEYDVRFSGNWRCFFSNFTEIKTDFIAAHIYHNQDEPDWPFWELTHPVHSIPLEDRLRCFHPIYRISKAALHSVYAAHQDGWRGHSEVLLPTLLHQYGFSIADINSEYVPPVMQSNFYTSSPPNRQGRLDSGTLRYRPVYSRPGSVRNKLYHPVKPNHNRLKDYLRTILSLIFGKPLAGKLINFVKSSLRYGVRGEILRKRK